MSSGSAHEFRETVRLLGRYIGETDNRTRDCHTHKIMVKIAHLLDLIAEDQGYIDRHEMMDDGSELFFDSCQPGVCRDESCHAVTYPHEPDARRNHCEICGGNTVIALGELVMAGGLG